MTEKLVKLSDVEEIIKIMYESQPTEWREPKCKHRQDVLIELLPSIQSLPTQNVPEIDNFYEFSESGNVWFKGRLARYTYLSMNGGMMNARYIRNLPTTN